MSTLQAPRTPSKLFLTLIATGMCACSGSARLETYSSAKKLAPVKAVVLLAPDMFFRGMKAHDVFEKWSDLADLLASSAGLVVVGPDEFHILTSHAVSDLVHETDVGLVLGRYGIDPENALALKLTLTEAWQQASSEVSNQRGGHAARAAYESELQFAAEVYHVASTAPVFAFSDSERLTTWDSPSASDPRPELTRFALDCYQQVLASMLKLPVPGPSKVPPWAVVVQSPYEAARFAFGELPALVDALSSMDEVDREAALNARLDYRHPSLPRPAVKSLLTLPAGVYVLSSTKPELHAGDIILKASGIDLNREYQAARFLRSTPLVLEVVRDGSPVTISIGP